MDANCTTSPSPRSRHGLDWLNFFVADVRTGVGPFVAIYLTENHWNVQQIGIALTAAELAGVLTQAPGGAITDYFIDIQSTGQKSHCVSIREDHRNALF